MASLLPACAARAQDGAPAMSYGPITLCVAGYALEVTAEEAAIVQGPQDGFLVQGDGVHMLWADADASTTDDRKLRASKFAVPGIGEVTRLHYPTQSLARAGIPGEVVWTDEPAHTDYLLPGGEGRPPVRIRSTLFRGDARDLPTLARFAKRSAATQCERPRGSLSDPAAKDVMQWSPVRRQGPAYVCEGLLGLAVRDGEFAQQTWLGEPGAQSFQRITGNGYRVEIFGWRAPDGRKSMPTGPLLAMGYRVEIKPGGATLHPPAAYPRDGGDNGLVYVNAFGLDAPALTEFLGRLEYLPRRDRRCNSAKKAR